MSHHAPEAVRLAVDGFGIHCLRATSDRRNPPLVLLHHAGGSSRRWSRVLPELARAWTVWAPDLPGHGASDLPEGSVWTAWRRFLTAFLEAAEIGTAPVVAHSLSGVALVQAALLDGLRLPRAVLVAPPAGHDLPAPIRISRAGAAERAVTWRGFQDAVRRRLAADPEALSEEDWEAVHEDFVLPGTQAALRTLLKDYPDLDELPDPPADLFAIDLVWMERDAMVPPRVPGRWRRALPRARHHHLPRVGHLPMLESIGAFLRLVERLLAA